MTVLSHNCFALKVYDLTFIFRPILQSPKNQSKDKEADGNIVPHLLRHPHVKHGAVDGQNRTMGAFGGSLIKKHAVNVEFLWGTIPLL